MLSKWARTWDGKLLRPVLSMLARFGVTPDALTLVSLGIFVCAGLMFAAGQQWLAVCLIVIGGILDSLDGELARFTQHETVLGSFLDSVCDHYGDFAIYLGLLWYFLGLNAHVEIALIFIAMFGSEMGSQVRSRAGMLGIDTRWTGAFTRFERLVVLIMGVLIGQVTVALVVLAVANNFSACQRVVYTVRLVRGRR